MRKKAWSKSHSFLSSSRHPFACWGHPTYGKLVSLIGVAFFLVCASPLARAGDKQGKKGAHADDFLLFGTVFTEQGFTLPGAEVRVRRTGERKARWEARSDRRGEFAVRVPQGAAYEMSVRAAGYLEQTIKIDARTGNREDLVFRLQPVPGGKPK